MVPTHAHLPWAQAMVFPEGFLALSCPLAVAQAVPSSWDTQPRSPFSAGSLKVGEDGVSFSDPGCPEGHPGGTHLHRAARTCCCLDRAGAWAQEGVRTCVILSGREHGPGMGDGGVVPLSSISSGCEFQWPEFPSHPLCPLLAPSK